MPDFTTRIPTRSHDRLGRLVVWKPSVDHKKPLIGVIIDSFYIQESYDTKSLHYDVFWLSGQVIGRNIRFSEAKFYEHCV